MVRYLLVRAAYALPVIWLVVSVVFLLIHLVPGDPILQMLGEGAPAHIRPEKEQRENKGKAAQVVTGQRGSGGEAQQVEGLLDHFKGSFAFLELAL